MWTISLSLAAWVRGGHQCRRVCSDFAATSHQHGCRKVYAIEQILEILVRSSHKEISQIAGLELPAKCSDELIVYGVLSGILRPKMNGHLGNPSTQFLRCHMQVIAE